jgi:glutamate dehydrogenase (NAD(P)+)
MTEPTIAITPSREATWERYAEYLERSPEIMLEWNDPETSARGWLVINSLRGGAAGGGTRMRAGLTRDEVQYLAKVMELKFSISGPQVGGAKSGIDFDPDDPRKQQVLKRWFRAIKPFLERCYSTAGDLSVDEVRDVLPAVREMGLHHPQQGLACGHLGLKGEHLATRLDALRLGLGQSLPEEMGIEGHKMVVADVVTGFSVAVSGLRLYERQGRSLEGVRVLMEGFGRVGGAAALYLARWGARIVGIVDDRHALISEEGLDASGVEDLMRRQKSNRLPSREDGTSPPPRDAFGEIPADLLVCAAASGTVDYEVLDRLEQQGVSAILCGANHPFAASGFGDTSVERAADEKFAVVADFIANLGTAHAFATLLQHDEPVEPTAILDSIEMTVCSALDEAIVRAGRPDRGLLAAALEGALARVSETPEEE